jgi:aldose 1-epimerase
MQRASHAGRTPRPSRRGALIMAIAAVLVLGASALALARGQRETKAHAAQVSITSKPWGTVDGKAVNLYRLSNGHMSINITNFGGIIQSIEVPGRTGRMANIALGFSNLAGYQANDVFPQPSGGSGTTYFGATIGRYANRIANGEFTLNGKTYHLPQNNGTNTLHGGPNAWNDQVWAPTVTQKPGSATLALKLVSPNGQNGFPGTVVATVEFTLNEENALRIHYHATTDQPTVINMTNHTYFNLAGQASGDVFNQRLMINADSYTPTNSVLIPTGSIDPVAGTPLDFRTMKPIGRDITTPFQQLLTAHGYDQNWVLNRDGAGLSLAARAVDPKSGRQLTVYTTEPGVQLYSSNFLVGDLVGTTGKIYRQSDGFTLETQHYPNSPNQPNFPSTTLNPGTPFNSTTVFKFSVAGRH